MIDANTCSTHWQNGAGNEKLEKNCKKLDQTSKKLESKLSNQTETRLELDRNQTEIRLELERNKIQIRWKSERNQIEIRQKLDRNQIEIRQKLDTKLDTNQIKLGT